MSEPARPQYGEYASAEEQRARIRVPQPPPPQQPPAAGPEPARRGGRTGDRIATLVLLGYGLFNVVSTIPALADYAGYAQTLLGVMGVDAKLADPAAAQPWGVAAAVVLGVGWLLTALLSWLLLRRGRLTFWVPLAGGLVWNLLSGILAIVPLMNDPAIREALLTLGR